MTSDDKPEFIASARARLEAINARVNGMDVCRMNEDFVEDTVTELRELLKAALDRLDGNGGKDDR
jgi:hypothetical protein|tara:strand:+ start:130 stop:324 length:195 start_codon:yes stop_codon:yes gene_type:complete